MPDNCVLLCDCIKVQYLSIHMGEKVFIEFLDELGRQFYEYSTESTELFA